MPVQITARSTDRHIATATGGTGERSTRGVIAASATRREPLPHELVSAAGHSFGHWLVCENHPRRMRSRRLNDPNDKHLICGTTWAEHQNTREPCRWPDMNKKFVNREIDDET